MLLAAGDALRSERPLLADLCPLQRHFFRSVERPLVDENGSYATIKSANYEAR